MSVTIALAGNPNCGKTTMLLQAQTSTLVTGQVLL